jgi:hypothetical protein
MKILIQTPAEVRASAFFHRFSEQAGCLLLVLVTMSFFASAFSALGQETEDKAALERDTRRLVFLQKNFKKFVPVEFKKDPDDSALAALQVLAFKPNKMEFEGSNYFGFKFTMPAWTDGDFTWMFLTANTEKQKDMTFDGSSWFIIQETGSAKGFRTWETEDCQRLRVLHGRFPYAKTLFLQRLTRDRLEPGKTYAIWFGTPEKDFPDIAFSMTIDSKRGKQECGWPPFH